MRPPILPKLLLVGASSSAARLGVENVSYLECVKDTCDGIYFDKCHPYFVVVLGFITLPKSKRMLLAK